MTNDMTQIVTSAGHGRSLLPLWRAPAVTRVSLDETAFSGGSVNDGNGPASGKSTDSA